MLRRPLILLLVTVLGSVTLQAQEADSTAPRLRILVTNDDGFQAPGLIALVDSLVPIADLVVAAPREQQSGTSHGITFRDPISVSQLGNRYNITWYAIDARPATCVRLALAALLDSVPDLVVSGINTGENIGVSAWLSGTVAAAREGALAGLPAIAASVRVGGSRDFAVAAGEVRRLVQRLRADGRLVTPMLLNVNVPSSAVRDLQGIKTTRMALELGSRSYERRVSPRGRLYFWDTWEPPEEDANEQTDLYWFARGFVTVTPLSIDQTDTVRLQELRALFHQPER
ncbi:MAG: 5'/3'-nucleotidase SurE [Gemmatimonadales bacterium]